MNAAINQLITFIKQPNTRLINETSDNSVITISHQPEAGADAREIASLTKRLQGHAASLI